jgi:hypothetical protein
MYPNSAYDPSSAIAAIFAGGLVFFVIWAALVFLGFYVGYRILKSAVRNGTVEALKKTGYADELGHRVYAPVYPQVQNYGAPPAPSAEQRSYYNPGQ